jgi:hypothetical protein
MTAARSVHLAIAACWTLVCGGCAGFGGNTTAGQPPLPGAGARDTITYEPPVPVTSLPVGEPRPAPATGWSRFNFDHFTETFKTAVGRGPSESVARLYYSQGDALYRQKKYHDAA